MKHTHTHMRGCSHSLSEWLSNISHLSATLAFFLSVLITCSVALLSSIGRSISTFASLTRTSNSAGASTCH